MTLEDIEKLREAAANRLGSWVIVQLDEDGWDVTKSGPGTEDLRHGTVEQAIAKLKEWARPPKPDKLAVTLPYEEVFRIANIAAGKFADACREALAPYES